MPHRHRHPTLPALLKELAEVDNEIEETQAKLRHLESVKIPIIIKVLRFVPVDRMEPAGSAHRLPLNPFIDAPPRSDATLTYVRYGNDTDGFLGDTHAGELAVHEQEQLLLAFNRMEFMKFFNRKRKRRTHR